MQIVVNSLDVIAFHIATIFMADVVLDRDLRFVDISIIQHITVFFESPIFTLKMAIVTQLFPSDFMADSEYVSTHPDRRLCTYKLHFIRSKLHLKLLFKLGLQRIHE